MKTFFRVILSIIAMPFALAVAICLIPFAILFMLVDIPILAIQYIWDKSKEEDSYEY